MGSYAAFDVSDKMSHLWVVDETGDKRWQGACATDPAAMAQMLGRHAPGLVRVVLETGSLSAYLYHGLVERGVEEVVVPGGVAVEHVAVGPDDLVLGPDERACRGDEAVVLGDGGQAFVLLQDERHDDPPLAEVHVVVGLDPLELLERGVVLVDVGLVHHRLRVGGGALGRGHHVVERRGDVGDVVVEEHVEDEEA